jgi:hypothetical protein
MGMDVIGIEPASDAGRCFRARIHQWAALTAFLEDQCLEIYARGADWHSNAGGGLNSAADSSALGIRLIRLLMEDAVTPAIEALRRKIDETRPDVECPFCQAEGKVNRYIAAYITHGLVEAHAKFGGGNPAAEELVSCPNCAGDGTVHQSETSVWPTEDSLRIFAMFCLESGGFRIL